MEKTFAAHLWKLTQCDDGVWMIHTDGDTIAFGDPNHQDPNDKEIFEFIIKACQEFEARQEATPS